MWVLRLHRVRIAAVNVQGVVGNFVHCENRHQTVNTGHEQLYQGDVVAKSALVLI